DGQPHLPGVSLREYLFLMDRRIAGARAYGEVVGPDDDLATVERSRAGDEIGRREFDQGALLIVGRKPCQRADLVEAARICERFDALPNRQLALCLLARDFRRSAHGERQFPSTLNLLDFRAPTGVISGAGDPLRRRPRVAVADANPE